MLYPCDFVSLSIRNRLSSITATISTTETNKGISIPNNNPPVVRQWNPVHVKEFPETNRDRYQFSDRDIDLITEEGVCRFALLGLTERRL